MMPGQNLAKKHPECRACEYAGEHNRAGCDGTHGNSVPYYQVLDFRCQVLINAESVEVDFGTGNFSGLYYTGVSPLPQLTTVVFARGARRFVYFQLSTCSWERTCMKAGTAKITWSCPMRRK